jgi:ribosomal-protein-alanine N-acetyltransferase
MIQILSDKHITECTDLHKLCFDKPWTHTEFRDYFDNDLMFFLGAWDNNMLVGLLSMMLLGTEAEIYTLCVHPNYRQKNIATDLIKTAQQESYNRLITDMFLEVSVDNQAAIRCYTKNNFKIITTRKDYYMINQTPVDAYMMRFRG